MGEAGSYGYLARAALAANRRSAPSSSETVPAGSSARSRIAMASGSLSTTWSRHSRTCTIRTARALAFFLAWHLARDLGEATTSARAEAMSETLEQFDAPGEPTPDDLAAFEAVLASAVEVQAKALEQRGEDPVSPLS